MVVVAYPLRCGDKDPVGPASIEIVAAQGQAPRRDGELATGAALARLLPGMNVPPGAMAAVFNIDRPRATDTIKIAYPDGGCGAVERGPAGDDVYQRQAAEDAAAGAARGPAATERPVFGCRRSSISTARPRPSSTSEARRRCSTPRSAPSADGPPNPRASTAPPIVTPVTLQVRFGS